MKKSVGALIATLATLLLASFAGVRPLREFQCGCEYGNCGCRPIGTPHITPQQQTPAAPTLIPYQTPTIVTPVLPNAPTPTLRPIETIIVTTLPPPPVLPSWTPLPTLIVATTMPLPPLPTATNTPIVPTRIPTQTPGSTPAPPLNCPPWVRVVRTIDSNESYTIYYDVTTLSATLTVLNIPSSQYSLFSFPPTLPNMPWRWQLIIYAPYDPTDPWVYFTISDSVNTYTCRFQRIR